MTSPPLTPELREAIEERAHEIVEAFKQDRTAAGLKRYLADEMFNVACLAQQQERERAAKLADTYHEIYAGGSTIAAAIRKHQPPHQHGCTCWECERDHVVTRERGKS